VACRGGAGRESGVGWRGVAQDITIGVAGPMTGQYASFGTQLKNGADAAVADINAPRRDGQEAQARNGDDACDPKQPAQSAKNSPA